MKRRLLCGLFLIVALAIGAFNPEAVKSSVVAVMPEVGGLGAGVCISPDGYILTAAHNIMNWIDYGKRLFVMYPDTPKLWTADLVYCEANIDIALIKANRENAPFANLSIVGRPALGDNIYVWGHPGGAAWILGKGVVSSIKYDKAGAEFIFGDPTVYYGNSGSPVFNEDGDIIAIVQAMYAGYAIAVATDWLVDLTKGFIVADQYLRSARKMLKAQEEAYKKENKELLDAWEAEKAKEEAENQRIAEEAERNKSPEQKAYEARQKRFTEELEKERQEFEEKQQRELEEFQRRQVKKAERFYRKENKRR